MKYEPFEGESDDISGILPEASQPPKYLRFISSLSAISLS